MQPPTTMRIGTEGAYPPYNYVDERGRTTGFEVELARRVAKLLHQRPVVTRHAWGDVHSGKSIFHDLVEGRFDVLAASAKIDATRTRLGIAWSVSPYGIEGDFFYLPRGHAPFDQDNLGRLRIAIQGGTVMEDVLRDRYRHPDALVTRTATADEAVALLLRGEVDAVVTKPSVIRKLVTDPEPVLVQAGSDFYEHVGVPNGGPAWGVRRDAPPALLAGINAAIDLLWANGEATALAKRFGGDILPPKR